MSAGFVSVAGNMALFRFRRLMGIVLGVKPGAGADHLGLLEDLTWLEHFAHFCRHTGQNFIRNRCLVRASALSFSSLLGQSW